MNRFLLLALTAALSSPAFAEVDPKVHKMCLPAQDYPGCVKLHSGITSQRRTIVDEGLALDEGNSCPSGMAYIGGGTCRSVVCLYVWGSNNEILAGKDWKCDRGPMKRKILDFGTTTAKTFNAPECPNIKLKKGWNSTCSMSGL